MMRYFDCDAMSGDGQARGVHMLKGECSGMLGERHIERVEGAQLGGRRRCNTVADPDAAPSIRVMIT